MSTEEFKSELRIPQEWTLEHGQMSEAAHALNLKLSSELARVTRRELQYRALAEALLAMLKDADTQVELPYHIKLGIEINADVLKALGAE